MLKPVIEKILERYLVKRIIAVVDRGLLSIDNLQNLQAMRLPNGNALEFILAVLGRRYSEFVELLEPLQARCADAEQEVLGETPWNDLRLVMAHDPLAASEAHAKRDALIQKLEDQASAWVGKLDDQDGGEQTRGRKLSDGGVRARFYHEVCEAHLSRIVRVDLKGELFTYTIDEKALAHARLMDGKLLLVINVTDLAPAAVVKRCKALADIERGFRMLKSEIKIGPIYHRLPRRIRAHAAICFMALIFYRVMRAKLRAAASSVTPEKALAKLRRIQHQKIVLNKTQPVTMLSTITQEHASIQACLNVKKPTLDPQLTLL